MSDYFFVKKTKLHQFMQFLMNMKTLHTAQYLLFHVALCLF